MSEANSLTTMQGIASWPARIRSYTEDLRDEMKLVTWPSWKQVRATTAVVIAAVFLFAAYFAVVDQIVGNIVERIFNYFAGTSPV